MEDQSPVTEKPTRRDTALLGLRENNTFSLIPTSVIILIFRHKGDYKQMDYETRRTETEYKEPMLGTESPFTITQKYSPILIVIKALSPEPTDADCTHKSKH